MKDIKKAVKISMNSTCQLFQVKSGTKQFPQADGCGILFQYNSNYYCLTNSHVVAGDKLGKTFILLKDGRTMTLGGQYYSTQNIDNNPLNDFLDVTVIKLEQLAVNEIIKSGHVFIKYSEIKTGHTVKESDRILILGYPASKTMIDNKNKKIISLPLILVTKPYLKKMNKLHYKKELHHIVEYKINTLTNIATGKKTRGPNTKGISGSGFWLLTIDEKNELKPILIGIMTEYVKEQAILTSTRIDFFVDLIKQMFDSTIQNNGSKFKIIIK